MNMQPVDFCIKELELNMDVFLGLITTVNHDQVHWKLQPEKWNLLEIICHLHDEEREDFRTRLQLVLTTPGMGFPSIDPQAWVTQRNYDLQDFTEVFQKFCTERRNSIIWLKSLKNSLWDNTFVHEKVGPMSGKFILANWVAHDYLHIRQITRWKYDYLKHFTSENLNYAGDW